MNQANDNVYYPTELYEDVFIEAMAEMEQSLEEMITNRSQLLTETERSVLLASEVAAKDLYEVAFAIAAGRPLTDVEIRSYLDSAVQQMRSARCLAKTASR
jgi:hypothetical protein